MKQESANHDPRVRKEARWKTFDGRVDEDLVGHQGSGGQRQIAGHRVRQPVRPVVVTAAGAASYRA